MTKIEQTHIEIPIPIHPSERDMPRSLINYQLPSGKVVTLNGLPMQGPKTIQAIKDTLEIWKPSIVCDDPPPGSEYEI